MIQYTTVPRPILLIRQSPLLSQNKSYIYDRVYHCPITSPTDMRSHYQSNWYDTVYNCPSTSHTDMAVHHYLSTSPTNTIQSTSGPVLVLLILYSQPLSQYQSYWHPTAHYCPSTNSTDTKQSITAPALVLLIQHSTLLTEDQSYWYDTVHCYHSTSPTYTIECTTVPLLILLMWDPITNPIDTTLYTLPKYQPYRYDSKLLPQYQSY